MSRSKGDQALEAITAIKQDMEKLKNLLPPKSKETPEDLIKRMSKHLSSLKAYFKGADRGGARMNFPSTPNEATTGVNAALETLRDTLTVTGKQSKQMNEVIKLLGEMNNAIKTLDDHLGKHGHKTSKGVQALKAITAIKKDMEEIKNSLLPSKSKENPEDLIKRMSKHLQSLDAYFRPGADRGGARMNFPSTPNEATTGVNAALETLRDTLKGKQSKQMNEVIKPLAPIVKMLGEMNNAIKTLIDHLGKHGYKIMI